MKKRKLYLYLLPIIIFIFSCSDGMDDVSFGAKSAEMSTNNSGGGSSGTGTGGSLARFAVVDDYLYAVNNESIAVFNVSTPSNPEYKNHTKIATGIETIFPKDSLLFIGSQFGMFIYDIADPENPEEIATYEHVFSCDPVVVQGDYAYVTLRSESDGMCWRDVNELQIVNISDLTNIYLQESYDMTNPKGLGIDGNTLFVCDDGLKVYDVSDPGWITLEQEFEIEANDVIPLNGLLLVVGDDGFYQYSYLNNTISLLSSILVTPIESWKSL